jgi:hypothetical protein
LEESYPVVSQNEEDRESTQCLLEWLKGQDTSHCIWLACQFQKWADQILTMRETSAAIAEANANLPKKQPTVVIAMGNGSPGITSSLLRNPGSGILWVKKLSNATLQYINAKPFFTKNHQINLETMSDTFTSVILNQNLLNMLSLKPPTREKILTPEFKQIFNNILVRTWMNWWTSVFTKRDGSNSVLMTSDHTQIDDVDMMSEFIIFNSVSGKLTPYLSYFWSEKWIEGDQIYSCTYVVIGVKISKGMGKDQKPFSWIY